MNTDSFLPKIIGILVAIVVFSLVLVPIVNSAGQSGGDSSPITYTNTGDFYYKSATADNSVHTFEYIHKEYMINEEDWEWIESYEIDGVEVLRYSPDMSELNIPRFFIGWSDTAQYWIDPGNSVICKEPGSINNALNIELTDLVETDTSYEFTYSLSIQNGTMSYVDMNTHQTQTVPIKYYLSSEEQGDYVLSETPIVAKNTDIYIAKEGYAPETNNQGGEAYYTIGGKINSSELIQDTVTVQGVEYYGMGRSYQEGTLYCEMNSIEGNNILTLSSMEVTGYITLRYDDTYHTSHYFEFTESIIQFLVPTTVTVEGSADENDTNFAYELLKIVPIFVALGILLGIVGMFYTSKMESFN